MGDVWRGVVRCGATSALSKPGDLNGIWFSLEETVVPPSWVYVELNDRATNTRHKSNLAETTP